MKDGDLISLNFALSLEEGGEIDSNLDGKPVSMRLGDGSMLPGFEAALAEYQIGVKQSVTLGPEQAFGLHLDENIQEFSRADFESDLELETGLVVGFTDAAGGELPGVVSHIESDKVVIDFNHPLAGKSIIFTAVIHSVNE